MQSSCKTLLLIIHEFSVFCVPFFIIFKLPGSLCKSRVCRIYLLVRLWSKSHSHFAVVVSPFMYNVLFTPSEEQKRALTSSLSISRAVLQISPRCIVIQICSAHLWVLNKRPRWLPVSIWILLKPHAAICSLTTLWYLKTTFLSSAPVCQSSLDPLSV